SLRSGGRFVGVNDYTDDAIEGVRAFDQHGFRKIGPEPYVEGTPILYEFLLPAGRSFAITNYYWRPETYLAALRQAGLADAAGRPSAPAPDVNGSFAPGHFDDLIGCMPMAALTARHPG